MEGLAWKGAGGGERNGLSKKMALSFGSKVGS